MVSEQPPWLAQAWRELGQSEVAGSRHNPRITAYFKELGHEKHARDEVAWCAAFVGACLERSGHKSTRSLMARSYATHGTALDNERLGCLAVLKRGNNPAFGHVGFVVGWSKERLWLLGGNQGDAVSVTSYPRSRLVALRWPEAEPLASQTVAADVFPAALEHVLEMEGGYTDDPHDPGGPTNKGITLRRLASWRKTKIGPTTRKSLIADLKSISDSETRAIYHAKYWRPAGCPQMPAALAFFHFDAAVNHGVNGATRMLQQALGVTVDGEIGPETRGKYMALPVPKILALYAAIRRKRYRALPHFWRFGRGWLRRVTRTLERANKQHANGQSISTTRTPPDLNKGDSPMQNVEDSKPKWWGESMTIWGALITAAAAVLPTLGPIVGLDINATMIRDLGDQVLSVAQAVAGLIGTAMTIYGRSRAIQPLMRRDITVKL
ncbi:MAG: TIGR02594 family protein [Alphaproteobacteria bacterium]|nr:TIGR02594 family protein [Alphaproteobacteria bacterium]